MARGGNNNPTGRGGFADNPQNSAKGKWSKETSISYWQNYYIRLGYEEFTKAKSDQMTMAQKIAYNNVFEATKDLAYQKELSDRTEGKPQVYTELKVDGQINIDPKTWV